ncbi:MAG: ABC transporter permease [Polyangiaceae bacterium]|nr:ABC transporter permease [Polyangiaceae bacterium]
MSWLLRRLAVSAFTVWAVVTATFVVFNVLPEDPARVIAGPQARPADVARIREQLGLDRPLHVRYGRFFGGLISLRPPADPATDSAVRIGGVGLDLGVSYLRRRPVTELLGKALPPTLLLGVLALIVQVVVGGVAGCLAAARRNGLLDWGTVALTLIGISAPTFLTGLLLQHFFARTLGWFPLDGYGATWGERLHAAALPAATLGLFGAAYYTRLVRDEMLVLLRQDWVRTAWAKGLPRWRVLVRHALRNALMPLVTVVGLELGGLVGGAIVTEKIFRWPGIGSLSVDAIVERDGPVVFGVVLLLASTVVAANFLVDLAYAVLDPRVRRR